MATLSTTSLAAGTHSITASYSGDSKDNSSVSQAVSSWPAKRGSDHNHTFRFRDSAKHWTERDVHGQVAPQSGS